jgi:unsaturated chondroitin disaccharide hydrolase
MPMDTAVEEKRMFVRNLGVGAIALWSLAYAVACSSDDTSDVSAAGGNAGSGGAVAAGGNAGSGGAVAGSGGAGTGGAVAGSGGAGTGGAVAGSGGAAGAGGPAAGSGGVAGGAGAGGGTGGAGGSGGQIEAGTDGARDGGDGGSGVDVAFCTTALDAAAKQYAGFRTKFTDPTKIPRSGATTTKIVGPSDWTSGFVAGSFWYIFEHTKDPSWQATAETWTAALESQKTNTGTHDIGFMINSSFGNGYRLTSNAAYKAVLTTAAQSLSTRYNATVGCTRSWDDPNWKFPVIIDNTMNLELLYVGAELGGSANFKTMAVSHSDKVTANHLRADGGSFHLVDYDPATGAVVKKQTVQGANDASTWARGEAWGLYGLTMSYRKSKETRLLDAAKKMAVYVTQNKNMPADKVPYWDYDYAAYPAYATSQYRDASAGAITASALLELSSFVPGAEGIGYRDFALAMLRSLSGPGYAAALDTNANFLLMHSVGSRPANSEVDVPINYADYYYLEALTRCKTFGK